MSYHLTYRPQTFDEVIGNKPVISSLKSLLKSAVIPKVYFFSGISGVGKTTLARILAKSFGAKPIGIVEIDAGKYTGVDQLREITQAAKNKIPGSPVSVYIIDECHKLSSAAQDAFLKSLEDTPKHVYYILATTDPQNIKETILTRCQQFQLQALNSDEIIELLLSVCEKENLNVGEEALEVVVNASGGSCRLALTTLEKCKDQLTDVDACETLTANQTFSTIAVDQNKHVKAIMAMLHRNKDASSCWREMGPFLSKDIYAKKVDVVPLKKGLASALGWQLNQRFAPRIAEVVIILENSALQLSNAFFSSVLTKMVNAYYASPKTTTSSDKAGKIR